MLLDLGLPDIDGVDVCRQLRVASDTAIIVVTARGEEADRVLALDEGADDYLVKPFGLAELLARIRAVLRRGQRWRRQRGAQARAAHRRHADPEGHRVRHRGRADTEGVRDPRVPGRHPGRLVSRQEIVERAWDEHWYGPTKVLDVHLAGCAASSETRR